MWARVAENGLCQNDVVGRSPAGRDELTVAFGLACEFKLMPAFFIQEEQSPCLLPGYYGAWWSYSD